MTKKLRRDDTVVRIKSKPDRVEKELSKVLKEIGFKEENVNFEGNE